MSIEFQRAVLRELDQICKRFESTVEKIDQRFAQAVTKLEERDEVRDSEVSDLKLQVGLLRAECRRNLKRDAGLVSVPTVVVSAIVAALNWISQPKAPQIPPPAPTAAVQAR